ncbi:MAG: 16S rRNA (guanine(527)-N(7))-methyltransferase RsmG [Syntrophales bacterium]|jgi:16S rRNA (guanine527-N7)-methyltransferase
MEFDFRTVMIRGSKELGIDLPDDALDQFAKYFKEIITWNAKINLISTRSVLALPSRHFIDSLTAGPFITERDGALLDIGSGAGLPGIPLKIAFPGLSVSLVESSRKKASFLKHVVRTLALKNVSVLQRRLEEFTPKTSKRGAFDTIISRAALKLPLLITMSSPFLAEKGVLIAMKGMLDGKEIEASKKLVKKTGIYLDSIHEISLPVSGELRNCVIYKKSR